MVKSSTKRAIKYEDDRDKKTQDIQDMISQTRARRYAWAISYLYPEIYRPHRLPDRYRLPTHVMTNKFQETLTIPSTQDFAIYFCPLADCFYNYRFNDQGQIYEGMTNTWGSHSYISYATNGNNNTTGTATGTDYVINSDGNFNSVELWNNPKLGSENLKKFKKIRLLGASVKITYTGRSDELSGVVKAAMAMKGFTTNLLHEEVTPDELVNLPQYKSFTLEKPVVCRYRISDENFTEFGPYTPYSTLPYYLIYGKGLQQNSTIFIEVIKHFEGIVTADQDEFVSPIRASSVQAPIDEQLQFAEAYKSNSSIQEFDSESHVGLETYLE